MRAYRVAIRHGTLTVAQALNQVAPPVCSPTAQRRLPSHGDGPAAYHKTLPAVIYCDAIEDDPPLLDLF